MKEEKQNSQNARRNRLVLIFAVVLLATACKKEMEPTEDNRKTLP